MPFQKGVSGNPKGRPKFGFSKADQWRAAADEIDPVSGKTYFRLFIEKQREKAIAGDSKAAELFAERVEGKIAQSIAISQEPPKIDYSRFTDEQIKQLEDLQDTADLEEGEDASELTIIDGQARTTEGEMP